MEAILESLRQGFRSDLPEKWQVAPAEYQKVLARILTEWTAEASQGRRLVRVAGQSGSGKTTQLVPATKAWYGEAQPVLVAAQRIAEYHPYLKEIAQEYGSDQVRQKIDDFCAIMMFLILQSLLTKGYDVILDLALSGPELETILIGWLEQGQYQTWMTMMAIAPVISEKWLQQRSWRHTKEVEEKFWRETERTLEFYAQKCPEMRIVIWSAWGLEPVFDGEIKDSLEIWQKYMAMEEGNDIDEERLREGKIKYFS